MSITVYKVMERIDDRLLSCFVWHKGQVEYKPGVLTRPVLKGTKLFVFDTFEYAKRFLDNVMEERGPTEIWECEAEGVGRPPDRICQYAIDVEDILAIWKWALKHEMTYVMRDIISANAYISPPRGTLVCDELTLVRRVL